MIKLLKKAVVLLCLISGTALAGQCDNLLPYGYPSKAAGAATVLLCRRAYVVDYSFAMKDPLYSAEHLTAAAVSGHEPRKPFIEDQSIPAESRAFIKDYVHSGYDKGHMSPAGDFHDDTIEMQESFLLSNMVPQAPANNRVVWRMIENFVRKEAVARGDVYIITGPIFTSPIQTIGADKVSVPSFTYKIVIDVKNNEGISFIVPNNSSVAGHKPIEYVHPITDVEKLLGRNMTPLLASPKSQQLKNIVAYSFRDAATHSK